MNMKGDASVCDHMSVEEKDGALAETRIHDYEYLNDDIKCLYGFTFSFVIVVFPLSHSDFYEFCFVYLWLL